MSHSYTRALGWTVVALLAWLFERVTRPRPQDYADAAFWAMLPFRCDVLARQLVFGDRATHDLARQRVDELIEEAGRRRPPL